MAQNTQSKNNQDRAQQPSNKTKSQATKTEQQARRTGEQAQKTGEQAQRTAQLLLTNGFYAAVGAGDSAVAVLRRLPRKAGELSHTAPRTVEGRARSLVKDVQHSPQTLRKRMRDWSGEAVDEFDTLAQRGRGVVNAISRSPATKRAVQQARTAQSQVKAATTSVTKAFSESTEAAESAADKVGQD